MSTSDGEMLAVAEKYLAGAGLKVLDRDYASTHGRADFIAADRGTLVVVALVSRIPSSMPTTGKKRMRRVALDWMDSHGRRYDRVRVDLVATHLEGTGGYTVEHARSMDA